MDLPNALSNEVEDYMKNNKEVPENVIKDLQKCLSAPQKELADMDAKIEGLEEQLTKLYETKSRLQQHMDRYDCLLSPIRRVPTDILHSIFFHCLPTTHDPIMSAYEAPLLLTRVCRVWRQTAYMSHSLWAQIYITFSDEELLSEPSIYSGLTKEQLSETLRLRCSAVEQWLSRSGVCPLSISICYTSYICDSITNNFPGNTENTLTLFGILARFSSRWQRLKLKMPIEVYRILETMVPVSNLSALTTFRTSFGSPIAPGNPPEGEQDITFFNAPNLAALSVTLPELWGSFRSTSSMSSPNLTTLTNLSVDWSITASQAVPLLKGCPNLEYLSLILDTGFSSIATFIPPQNMISLPLLRSIAIVDCIHPAIDAIGFYECIDAPRLESIRYLNESTSHESIHLVPVVILLKKSLELKNLTIEVDSCTSQDLRVILESAPSIIHLVFGPYMRSLNDLSFPFPSSDCRWDMGEVFLPDGLGKDESEEETGCDPTLTLLPNLEILDVWPVAASRLKDKTLLDIILSRLDPNSPTKKTSLKKVAVAFTRNRQIDIFSEVMAQSQHQIQLDLKYWAVASSSRQGSPNLSPSHGLISLNSMRPSLFMEG